VVPPRSNGAGMDLLKIPWLEVLHRDLGERKQKKTDSFTVDKIEGRKLVDNSRNSSKRLTN
jgi:hypothetical protein